MNQRQCGGVSIAGLVALVFLTGCGTVHNESRFTMAKQASDTFDGAKIVDSLKDERAQNQAIFERELQLIEQEMKATRNAELISVIARQDAKTAVDQLRDGVNARRHRLGVNAAKKAIAVRNAQDALAITAHSYRSNASGDDPEPQCNTPMPSLSSPEVESLWKNFQKDCLTLADAQKAFDDVKSGSGEVISASLEIDRIANEKKAVAAEVKRLTDEFKKEAAELKARQAPPADLAALAKKLRKNLDGITLPNAAPVSPLGIDRAHAAATLAFLDEARTHIDKLLDAAQSGTDQVPPGVDDDLQIATVLPSIAAELQAGFHYPRVSALVLESEHIRLERDRQKKILERLDAEEALLRKKRSLNIQELSLLAAAAGAIASLDAKECSADALLKAPSIAETPQKCRGPLAAALVNYSISWVVGRIPAEQVEWARMNLEYERSLDNGEAALAQWQNLVHVPLQALVTSYRGGVKPEEIGRLISGLELGAVAVGVQ